MNSHDFLNIKLRKTNTTLLLTPFIDIIFLMTLFFVLNTKFDQFEIFGVELPQANTGQTPLEEPLVVLLTADGNLFLNKEKSTWDLIYKDLENLIENNSGQIVSASIIADKDRSYQDIVSVMNALRGHSIYNISLGIDSSE